MIQLRLPLGEPVDARDVEFLVTESSARAIHQLDHWATWPVMAALLVGPRKSGRSMLARIFTEKVGGTMIDDAERVAEADIFHAWNAAQRDRRPLMIVADEPPPLWRVRLPDLRSRLSASPVLRLEPPDDALMGLLLQRYLDRRELVAKPELIAWLLRRVERSHLAVLRVADALEAEAHRRQNRRISIPVARATLSTAGLLCEPPAEPQSEMP